MIGHRHQGTVAEEISFQRRMLLEGGWADSTEGMSEGGVCLAWWSSMDCLSPQATRAIAWSIAEESPFEVRYVLDGAMVERELAQAIAKWNDEHCSSAGEAAAILERAEIIAKECFSDACSSKVDNDG